ncbi:hypothetical protein HYH03_016798 [Edaphochlamys debaryana]|uniref:RRM domain-containing protein n=1 Tax=Edaphochlamys debaryana TaxID=47281 RepID=A0A835XGU5_9CHLO|nr:hypothetical protein HYH03_016798 [Edaphochlamys debaryana]|eukprot:KAG2484382.1 hypothetical protein HYH03_016798 [Edaphochlamys debaryana]
MAPKKGGKKAAKADEEAAEQAKAAAAAEKAKQAMDDSGSDDSDGSSSDDDIEVDADTATKLMAIEQELKSSPSYEKHLEYIELLRSTPGLRTRLRDAHEALAAAFPLSEELWMGWINDELSSVSGPEDVAWVLQLMKRAATRDYVSPAIWELLLETSHDLDSEVKDMEPAGVERYRGLCEEALAAAGLHLAAGHGLWGKYRKYELAVEEKLAAAAAKGGSQAASKQQDRVRALYQRQLQVPLQDVAATLEEYKAWEAGHGKSVPAHVSKAADKAHEAAEVRAGCEAGVAPEAPADVAKLGAFLAYIKMEQNGGDPARVQAVYERAVAAFPMTHSLWLQYGQYMETHTKLPGPINAVYERATRNCYWVGAVWERALRALDRTGAPAEDLEQMCRKALAAGLQSPEDVLAVVLARVDALRHAAAAAREAGAAKKAAAAAASKLREAFREGGEVIMSRFPDFVDRSLRLSAYWAHCESQLLGDMAAAREVWEGALKSGMGRFVETWEAYIATERSARNLKEARAIYKRAFNRKFEEDGQLRICHAWLRFEREEGSADDYMQAMLKVEPILEESAAAAAATADQAAAAAATAAINNAKVLSKEEIRAMRQAHDPNFKADKKKDKKKDKKQDKKEAAPAENTAAPSGKGKRVRDGDAPAAEAAGDEEGEPSKRVRTQEPAAAAPPAPAAEAAAAAADADAEMGEGTAGDGEHHEAGEEHHDAAGPGPGADKPRYSDQQTAFIKGLRHKVQDAGFEAFLKQHVPDGIKTVRIVRDQEGMAKGFAYVECTSREALEKLVSINQTPYQGVALFIAESRPPGRDPNYAPGRGRGRGGPPFARGGFQGRGRGFGGRGYDGDGDTEMGGAGGDYGGRGRGRGFGGGRGHAGLGFPPGRAHPKTHLQVEPGTTKPTALVPRSVQLGAGGGGEGGAPAQPMSNDDFRKMLLGGKK